ARSSISFTGIPPAYAAPMSEPMLVPATSAGLMPRSSRARKTPMCANPFSPPPPSTSARRPGSGVVLTSRPPRDLHPGWPGALHSLEVLVGSVKSDAPAADHEDRPRVAADHGTDEERCAADDHERAILIGILPPGHRRRSGLRGQSVHASSGRVDAGRE